MAPSAEKDPTLDYLEEKNRILVEIAAQDRENKRLAEAETLVRAANALLVEERPEAPEKKNEYFERILDTTFGLINRCSGKTYPVIRQVMSLIELLMDSGAFPNALVLLENVHRSVYLRGKDERLNGERKEELEILRDRIGSFAATIAGQDNVEWGTKKEAIRLAAAAAPLESGSFHRLAESVAQAVTERAKDGQFGAAIEIAGIFFDKTLEKENKENSGSQTVAESLLVAAGLALEAASGDGIMQRVREAYDLIQWGEQCTPKNRWVKNNPRIVDLLFRCAGHYLALLENIDHPHVFENVMDGIGKIEKSIMRQSCLTAAERSEKERRLVSLFFGVALCAQRRGFYAKAEAAGLSAAKHSSSANEGRLIDKPIVEFLYAFAGEMPIIDYVESEHPNGEKFLKPELKVSAECGVEAINYLAGLGKIDSDRIINILIARARKMAAVGNRHHVEKALGMLHDKLTIYGGEGHPYKELVLRDVKSLANWLLLPSPAGSLPFLLETDLAFRMNTGETTTGRILAASDEPTRHDDLILGRRNPGKDATP